MHTSENLSPLQVLANAVIAQAANDYRRAIKSKNKDMIYNCESFFMSDRFSIMTNLNGKYLIDRIRREVNNDTDKFCKGNKKAVCNLSQ